MTKASEILHDDQEYEYGFHDDIHPVFSTGRGLTEEVVRAITGLRRTKFTKRCRCPSLARIYQN